MSQPLPRAVQPRWWRPGLARWAGLGQSALVLCAVLCCAPAGAGRTDSDWLAPAPRVLGIDAPGDLERLDGAQPAPPTAGGPVPAHAALVADMRIATHDEARALVQGGHLPGGADKGGGSATLSALLDRLSARLPSSAGLAQQRPDAAAADLDCALFAESVRVRRLLGTRDVHKPGESAGPSSAMWLDVPIRCLATVPNAALPARGRKAIQPAADEGVYTSSTSGWQRMMAWARPVGSGWAALAASSVALALIGIVVRTRTRTRTPTTASASARPADALQRRARDKAAARIWR